MNNITEIAEKVAEVVAAHLDEQISLTALERETREIVQEIGRQSIALTLKKRRQRYPDAKIACACGGETHYIRQRSTCLHTLFGKLTTKRAYYLCPDCHQGSYPLDAQLGLRPNQLSAELSRLVAMTGVQLPFGNGCALFEELTHVSVSDQAMAKATRQVGQKVVEKEVEAAHKSSDITYLARRKRETRRPRRLYGAIDAVKVPIRDDPEQRWRDLKIGAWFEAVGQPPTGPDGEWSIQAQNITYYADICPAREFGQSIWGSGVVRDAQLAHELVILGDGAEWIWNLVSAHFPNAIQILDWFHASEHLAPVAQAAFSSQEAQATWIAQMKQLMWQGEIQTLIEQCLQLQTFTEAKVIQTTAAYFDSHRQRLRYAHFRGQGYQIGSGTIESAAKQIGLMRMKVPGARWNLENARLIAKARAAFLSDRWASLPLAF